MSTQLPIARVKKIMKKDPDVSLISQNSVFLVAKATELFLEDFVREAFKVAKKNKV